MKKFFKRHSKLLSVLALACILCTILCIGTFATTSSSTPTAIPAAGDLDLSIVQELWTYGAGMLMDTIAIVSSQQLIAILVIALPLVGIGIGLFKRVIS